jgi:hypothetical protein
VSTTLPDIVFDLTEYRPLPLRHHFEADSRTGIFDAAAEMEVAGSTRCVRGGHTSDMRLGEKAMMKKERQDPYLFLPEVGQKKRVRCHKACRRDFVHTKGPVTVEVNMGFAVWEHGRKLFWYWNHFYG